MKAKTLGAVVVAVCMAAARLQAQERPSFVQPVPVEVSFGTDYISTNLVLSKMLSAESRYGFFFLNTNRLDYRDESENDLTMQSLVFFEVTEHFRLTGGLFFASFPGFNPTVGVQYINPGRKWFILLSPRVNIESEPSYSIFSILRYRRGLNERFGLYASLQALNTFDGEGHIKSYQWGRIGLAAGATQFGLAVNLDEFGPDPEVEFSLGVFVRRELF